MVKVFSFHSMYNNLFISKLRIKVRSKRENKVNELSASGIVEAENFLIKHIQAVNFPEDVGRTKSRCLTERWVA